MFGGPETWSVIEKWGNAAFAFYFTLAIYDWFELMVKRFLKWCRSRGLNKLMDDIEREPDDKLLERLIKEKQERLTEALAFQNKEVAATLTKELADLGMLQRYVNS